MKKKKLYWHMHFWILVLLVGALLSGCQSTSMQQREEYKYNLTKMSNNTGDVADFVKIVNDELMLGYLGLMLLIIFWVLSFFSFFANTNSGAKSMAGASFICFLISMFLLSMDILAPLWVFVMIILSGLFALISKNE
jgi:hypothetical protein